MYIFDDKSKIKFHKLIKRKEENSYIIGRKETEIYISTSKVGYEIISLIDSGNNIGEVKKTIKKKYGDFDVDKYINYLMLQDFIEKINNKKLQERVKKVKSLFNFIKPNHVSWLFTKPMYFLYWILIISALLIILLDNSYFPLVQDYFVFDKFIFLIPSIYIISWILLFMHELAHFLAARSYNLPSQFGISNRLFFLVAVTDITNIYSMDRKKRYRLILAGIFFDVLILSISIIVLLFSNLGIITLDEMFYKIIKFIAFSELLGILWQFLVYMKTDLYYALETKLKVYNLNDKSESLIRNEFYKLFIKNHHLSYFENKRDKKLVHYYSLILLAGVVLTFAYFFYYYIPIVTSLISKALTNIYEGLNTQNYLIFYDSMFFVITFLINFSLLAYATIRHYRLYLRPTLYYLVLFSLISTSYLVLLGMILTISVIMDNYTMFYIITSVASLIFALFLVYLVYRIDKFDAEDVFVPE